MNKLVAKLLVILSLTMMLILTLVSTASAKKRMVKKYIGKWYVTTYKPSDSSQNGHGTSSGRRAKSGRTVAVDYKKRVAKMGQWVYISGFGKRRVEDYGGFGKYNHGRRAFDVFIENHEKGGLWLKKCWIYRPETKKEKEKRLKKERLKHQGEVFEIKYDSSIEKPWQVITDPSYIKGGCISFGGGWFEVIKTKKGLKNTILVGDKFLEGHELKVKLDMVEEGAVG